MRSTNPHRARHRSTRSAAAFAVLAAVALTGAQPADASAHTPPGAVRAAGAGALLSPQEHAELLKEAARIAVELAKALHLDPREVLQPVDAAQDADGTVHFRYNRTFAALPVLGGDLVVHRTAQGALSDTRAHRASIGVPSTTPVVPAAQVAQSLHTTLPPRLVVWSAAGTPSLAWESVLEATQEDGTPSERHVVTDATTGGQLYAYEAVRTGIGQGQYNGTVPLGTTHTLLGYEMNDTARGGHRTYDMHHEAKGRGDLFTNQTDRWGSGDQSNDETAGVDAHYGAAQTWDYLQDVHGRTGIRGDGVGAYSRVHAGSNYTNAFWSDKCFCMTYGDGPGNAKPLTELDVAAHEMIHGLTSATAGLEYTGESGGLNESTSDIFGTAVSFHADNPTDVPAYLMGKHLDLDGKGTPLRYLDQPSKDGHSPDYWYDGIAGLDVHYSSGPANHFFYLLAEGSGPKTVNGYDYDSPTVDGRVVTGIGRADAERIWYRALTTYMTSTTDYSGARAATLQAAADLFGPDSATVTAVADTWSAVNVNS
ncbi:MULTISPECIES: M4 family metallopeptidase [Streptomycetaceae]|uniref:M4 family metallopeptidase n=1 Tax=Streptomycetaceae TaxID=2062 RepID=UPI00093AB0B8|nr:M4 family metallopeptidase [Streptomyces sp. CB02056]OKI06592.1 peptidase [Streptomyces sp. CB02056]